MSTAITPTPSRISISTTTPEIIPPTHAARTLVLCFDGTGDQFDDDNSNVELLFSALKKDDRNKQMVYYQTGIGTYTSPNLGTPIASRIAKIADQAVAWYLDAHVCEGYKFVMQNYIEGDKICLFGFSRGAYTARALAGMLHKVGLLPPHNEQQVPFAYKMYSRCDEEGWAQSKAFKKAFSIDVSIDFLGVWDTVCSVGVVPHTLPFVTSNFAIRVFRHALSLDEHRAKFMPNHWNKPDEKEQKLGDDPLKNEAKKKQKHLHHDHDHDHWFQDDPDVQETDVKEVWFSGCHCDVGGGSVSNSTPNSLARIPLRWMIKEAFLAKTGILFKSEVLAELGINPDALWPEVTTIPTPVPSPSVSREASSAYDESHTGDQPFLKNWGATFGNGFDYGTMTRLTGASVREERAEGSSATASSAASPATDSTAPTSQSVLSNGTTSSKMTTLTTPEIEIADIMSPAYDQLSIAWWWWILELLPMKHRYQGSDNKWHKYISWNFGRPRYIPHQHKGLKIHRSVKIRMENDPTYKPRASWEVEPEWVD